MTNPDELEDRLEDAGRAFKLAAVRSSAVFIVTERDSSPDAMLAASIIELNLKRLRKTIEIFRLKTGEELGKPEMDESFVIYVQADFDMGSVSVLSQLASVHVMDTRVSRMHRVMEFNASRTVEKGHRTIYPIYGAEKYSLSTIAWALTALEDDDAPRVLTVLDRYYRGKKLFHTLPLSPEEDFMEYLHVYYRGVTQESVKLLSLNADQITECALLGHPHTQARKRFAMRLADRGCGKFKLSWLKTYFIKLNCPSHLMDDIGLAVSVDNHLTALYELQGQEIFVKVFFGPTMIQDHSPVMMDIVKLTKEFADDSDVFSLTFRAPSKTPKLFKSKKHRFIDALLHA